MSEAPKYTGLQQYLENMATLFGRNGPWHVTALYFQWVLENGQTFTKNGLTDGARNADELVRKEIIQARQCYRNSMLVEWSLNGQSILEHRVEYMEGWALHPMGVPIDHAFNWSNGTLYDFTTAVHWEEEPLEWFGVIVPSSSIWEWNELSAAKRQSLTPMQHHFTNYILPQVLSKK